MTTRDTNPKSVFGLAKPSVSLIPPSALIQTALAFRDGAKKYTPFNWRRDPVSSSVYVDAAYRHMMSWWDGEEKSEDAKVHHLAHAIACMCILIDAQSGGTLVDDRPTAGVAAKMIKEETKPVEQ